jgi:AcrR family transcriptional regulator
MENGSSVTTRSARKPGRPPAVAAARLSADTIFERALRLAARLALDEISIVRIARELRVTPALIHYYLPGGRDALTSGIMNAFYRGLTADWPTPANGWRADVSNVAHHVFRGFCRYPGIAGYFVSNNRFRIFQLVEPGETDFGALAIERFSRAVGRAPLDSARTGVYAHLLLEFLASSAHSTARHRWPGEHEGFLKQKLAGLSKREYPNLHRVGGSLLSLDAERALDEGLELFLHGLSGRATSRRRSGRRPSPPS